MKRNKRIGVMMGGFTAERHISLESGRNVYSKLAASVQYDPLPLFLSGSMDVPRIFVLPVFLLLKDNADDIHDLLLHPCKFREVEALLAPIRAEAHELTAMYAKDVIVEPEELTYEALKERLDFMFLALHGRPGEDGTLQGNLERYAIPYNGSGVETMRLTIDKYATNQFLKQKGFQVPWQCLLSKEVWKNHQTACIEAIEDACAYPLIAKPVDDGCSTGVVKITNREALYAYAFAHFQKNSVSATTSALWALPNSTCLLLEDFIGKDQEHVHCLEITTGLLTHIAPDDTLLYEIFESSEVLAAGSVLSLEEKFLAGEGHNITPARFHKNFQKVINQKVKKELAQVAKVLHLQGYARIDAFVKVYSKENVEVWIIEVNALPAMTPATCIFHQCVLNGYTPFDFIDAIIRYGFTKRNFTIGKSV